MFCIIQRSFTLIFKILQLSGVVDDPTIRCISLFNFLLFLFGS